QGGTLSAEGRLNFGRGFPANLRFSLDNARYADGELVDTQLSADLALNGPVLGNGRLSGRIDIGKSEITVPNSFGIREGVLLDIEHRGLPPDAALTLRRAGLPERERAASGGSASRLRLELDISAPNQIFIRGRGLDAEMGGLVRLRGRVSDVRPTGQFALLRGRINILGQRIDFDEGVITLSGDFDPRIRLVASTTAQDTTVILTVQGRVSDPEITLSSTPELPQDELLALLIFQRNLSELTPFQVAQLATAAATLAGGGSGGLLEGLRASTGLSNLDVTTGEEGEIGVRAGAYLQENVYLDLEAEDDGDARATINIDITDSLRGRATFGNDGDSNIGIFFERDY
ncbi:MAG: translocation/assembly module TamB domain-containing protein, partial [Pseudomonadota bacterium]